MNAPLSTKSRVAVAGSRHVLLGMALCLALLPVPGRAADQTIVVYADRDLGPPRLRQGFVHGITYVKGKDYSRTVALIAALKPTTWRLANFDNDVYGFIVNEARFPQLLGTEIVFNLQDVFNEKYGWDVKIKASCGQRERSCFPSYDAFKKAWLAIMNAAMRIGTERKLKVDYIDVFAEPNAGTGKLGLTLEQYGEIFKLTHDVIRQYRPDAKIVAPSIAHYRERLLKYFLTFVAKNDIRLDALAWHEFETPEVVPAHVAEMREFFKTQPGLCNPGCPQIHINEYAPEEQYLIPAYGVGWLYYLEKAGVDQANRACWGLSNNQQTCWDGFEGILMQDNVTPRPTYWAYKAYADMSEGRRLASESTTPRTVAIASKDEGKRELRILAGRYGQKGASGRVVIEVRNFRYGLPSVVAEVGRIPYLSDDTRGMPAPPAPTREVIQVQNDALSIAIPNFQDGDAYSIVLRPGGGGK